jgi:hypothetical protein
MAKRDSQYIYFIEELFDLQKGSIDLNEDDSLSLSDNFFHATRAALMRNLALLNRRMNSIWKSSDDRQFTNGFIPRFSNARNCDISLTSLSYPDWQSHLNSSTRTRETLLDYLVTLYPAILNLGGEDAGRGVVVEMERVCKQWQ